MRFRELKEIIDKIEELNGPDFDPEIEVHQQMNYPLKGKLYNVAIFNNKLVLASGDATEYGNEEAWQVHDLCPTEDHEDEE